MQLPWVAVAQSANRQLRVCSDLTGPTGESAQTLEKLKKN